MMAIAIDSTMKSTPANDSYNADVLSLMPETAVSVVEVGCSRGALARAFLKINPSARYVGIEIEAEYAAIAESVCSRVLVGNVEKMDDATFNGLFPSDCWVLGDVLEHLYDPWALLKSIRARIDSAGCIVACIPNAQHWSVQARLNLGLFVYEDSGLLDRTHIRWFTRKTIIDMFESSGYAVEMWPRVLDEPFRESALVGVRAMAQVLKADPETAAQLATPFQWVVKAVPTGATK
jgi:trans-aconitate methyltransferase